MGHTNVMSTRNAFARYKKRWGFGNIHTKITGGSAAVGDEVADSGMFPRLSCFSFLFEGFQRSFELHDSCAQA
jgi:hypothetical protein